MSKTIAETDQQIAEIVEAHEFRSWSTSRNGFNTHHAGCACDPSIEFDWYEREAQHRAHLLAAVFAAGQANAAHAVGQDPTAQRVQNLIAEYDEEPHSDECGMGACVRCVVDEFANISTTPNSGATNA